MENTKIQWYPGHMKKALREINENIKLIDVVIEIVDARIPHSGKNPDIDTFAKDKPRIIILNKEDMADSKETILWEDYYKEKGFFCVSIDARNKSGFNKVNKVINEAGKTKWERDAKRGILKRPLKALICGIPNSGKSTFINSYMGKKSAKTGDKPGVTKGKQWVNLSKDAQMLDTPGILWPKFEDIKTGENLAICGCIKDEILKRQELAFSLIKKLILISPNVFKSVYNIDSFDCDTIFMEIAMKRGLLKNQGELDYNRCADLIIDDFRSGKLGRISLERVIDYIDE